MAFTDVPPTPSAFTLLEEHKLFRALWNDALIGLAIVSEDGHFLRANPAFCAVIEYSEPELRGMTFADVTHPADLEPDLMLAKMTARGERSSYTMKKRYLTKTGQIVWTVLHVSALHNPETKQFEFFLSQVLGLPGAGENVKLKMTEPQNKWLVAAFFRNNWTWMSAVLVAAGVVFAEVLKRLPF